MSSLRVSLSSLLLCTAVMALPVVANDEPERADARPSELPAHAEATPEMMENMKEMQDQMARIHATKDSAERARLMDEHMKTMQTTLNMMHDGGGCMMGVTDGRDGMGNMGSGHPNMMQMMMDQMVQHQKAMQGAR